MECNLTFVGQPVETEAFPDEKHLVETQEHSLEGAEDKEITFAETLRFIVFSIILMVVLMNQLATENAYRIAAATSSLLKTEKYEEITNIPDIVDWAFEDFFPTVAMATAYYDKSNIDGDYLRFAWFNRIIAPVRMVQRRVELVDNEAARTSDVYPKVWGSQKIDPFQGLQDGESTDSFFPNTNLDEICGDIKPMFEYNGEAGVRQSGGFQILTVLDIKSQEESSLKIDCAWKVVENLNWIDQQTGALYIDFGMYNSHYEMMTYVVFEFTFFSSGFIHKEMRIRSYKTAHYTTALDIMRAVMEAVYVSLVFYYTLIEIGEIRTEYEFQKTISRAEEDEEDSYDSYEDHPRSPKCRRTTGCLISLYRTLRAHMSTAWNIIDIASLSMSYLSIVFWILIETSKPEPGIDRDGWLINDILVTVNYLSHYVRFSSINLCLIFFRMVKYLGHFKRVRLLQATFSRSGGQIFHFFVMSSGFFRASWSLGI